VKGKSKQALLLELVLNFLNHETIFGNLNCEFDLLHLVLQLIDGQLVKLGYRNEILAFFILLLPLIHLLRFDLIQAPVITADVDIGPTVNISYLLFGQPQVNKT